MESIRIRGGHQFRLKHAPQKERASLKTPKTVAVAPRAFPNLKAKVTVKEGEQVKLGQQVAFDRKRPFVQLTAVASGEVKEIVYGPRRRLDAIVIETGGDDAVDFGATERGALAGLGQEKVVDKLVQSGLWSRMRAFPGWDVPAPPTQEGAEKIKAIYVAALSTEPHQPDPVIALEGNDELFSAGLEVIKQVAAKTWVISQKGQKLPASATSVNGVQQREMEPLYPAENVAVQAWYTDPLKAGEHVVGIGVEDVMDIGHLFLHGKLRTERTYVVAGNAAPEKKHIVAPIGVKVADLCGVDDDPERRTIAGGVFTGDKVSAQTYLAPQDRAVQVMAEDKERVLFPFFRIGFDRFSLFRLWGSSFAGGEAADPTTSNNGEERACVQCGMCIDVCPVELMPNLVFKACLTGDIERMEQTGIHDCADCGLCTFACPAKIELGQIIEDGKALIAKEG